MVPRYEVRLTRGWYAYGVRTVAQQLPVPQVRTLRRRLVRVTCTHSTEAPGRTDQHRLLPHVLSTSGGTQRVAHATQHTSISGVTTSGAGEHEENVLERDHSVLVEGASPTETRLSIDARRGDVANTEPPHVGSQTADILGRDFNLYGTHDLPLQD